MLLHTGVWSNDTTGITDLRPLTAEDWKTKAEILMSTPGLNNVAGCMLGLPSIAPLMMALISDDKWSRKRER